MSSTTVNGKPVESVPMLVARVEPVRGGRYRDAGSSPWDGGHVGERSRSENGRTRSIELAGLADPEKSAIAKLGIIGIDVGGRDGSAVAGTAHFVRRASWRRAPRCRPATRCRWSPAT